MKNVGEFKEGTCFDMGSGLRIPFWKDRWCGNSTLMEALPSLFRLACNKEAKIADYWVYSGEDGDWNVEMRRHLND